MSKLAMAVGGVFILGSVWLLVAPESVVSFINLESRAFIYVAALARILMGLVLILAASASRAPIGFLILGALMLLGGLLLPLIPVDLLVAVIQWITVEHLTFWRIAGSPVGILLGAFIVYAAQPKRTTA